jgi:hypothetical protein
MRITIFTYRDADDNGWPNNPSDEEYVRFLQDRGIQVGFLRDPDSRLFAAMVDAWNVDAVIDADKAALEAGVKKPPMVPANSSGG